MLAGHDWHGVVVFSSSASTYGLPKNNQPLVETDAQWPISPYGWSKLFCERVLADHCPADNIRGIALRYFNASGCSADVSLGHTAADTHIVPRVLSAYRSGTVLTLYGDDYDTPDGTCVRDYLHVTDIAQAHLAAVTLAQNMQPNEFRAYNLGTGVGYSNKEIVDTCSLVVGNKIDYQLGPRRSGDPDFLVADSSLFQEHTNWAPKNSSLHNIVKTAWEWQKTI